MFVGSIKSAFLASILPCGRQSRFFCKGFPTHRRGLCGTGPRIACCHLDSKGDPCHDTYSQTIRPCTRLRCHLCGTMCLGQPYYYGRRYLYRSSFLTCTKCLHSLHCMLFSGTCLRIRALLCWSTAFRHSWSHWDRCHQRLAFLIRHRSCTCRFFSRFRRGTQIPCSSTNYDRCPFRFCRW